VTVDWLARFKHYGAIRDGHFLLTSGLHSPTYVQSALILQHPEQAAALAAALADRVRQHRPQVVLAPALGGIVIAHELARALLCRAIFTERVDGRMQLRRGFAVNRGERVLVAEDVVTTGGSVAEVASVARAAAGVVVAYAALVDRRGPPRGGPDGAGPRAALALEALVTLDLATFAADACPLCRAGVPIDKPGSRGLTAATARPIIAKIPTEESGPVGPGG
jgi:orotate phosphoribosyltransferase